MNGDATNQRYATSEKARHEHPEVPARHDLDPDHRHTTRCYWDLYRCAWRCP